YSVSRSNSVRLLFHPKISMFVKILDKRGMLTYFVCEFVRLSASKTTQYANMQRSSLKTAFTCSSSSSSEKEPHSWTGSI
ncbi:hypothetical protein IRJ41_011530, partial [Triplophysa rosa]